MLLLALALAVAPADTVRPPGLAARLGLHLTTGVGVDVPLTVVDPDYFGGGRSGGAGSNAAMRVALTAEALDGLSATLVMYRYIVPRLQAPWNPDFVYAVRYQPRSLNGIAVSYANYDANRLQPAAGQSVTSVDRGVVSLAFGPAIRNPLRRVDSTLVIYPRVSYDVMPSYYDATAGGYRDYKQRAGVGGRVYLRGGLFADLTLHVYPRPSQQQPWDPDFTYGFGYTRGWPTSVTVQYANYSGNRFPGRPADPGTGRFRNGGFHVEVSHRF